MELINGVDILICSVPSLSLDRCPGAPALLKSACKVAGFNAAGIDLNINFFTKQCGRDIERYHKMSAAFRPNENASKESLQSANEWLNESIKTIQSYSPKIIGISVFTIFQHRASVMLASAIRRELPNTKIVMGGFGLIMNSNSLGFDGFKKIDLLKPFHQLALEKNLSDHIILGHGIDELIDYVSSTLGVTNTHESVANPKTIYSTPIPDYDDYNLSDYVWNDGVSLPITGSRGCVRSCTFCDIPTQFGKFSYRTGTDIAKEMIHLKERYGVNDFEFTDSLVNGSMKSFKEWLTVLSEYNSSQTTSNKIRWFGQYICRPQSQTPPDIYSLMKGAGAKNLIIGVESGSDEVLEAMKKKMKVQDVYDEMEQFKLHGLQAHVLMLSGFYNETWDRFVKSLEFIVSVHKYFANGTITKLSVGPPLFINDEMHLGNAADELGIIRDPYDDFNWRVKDDPSNDFVERSRRRLITQLVLDKLGIPQSGNSIMNLHQVLAMLKQVESKL